MREVPSLVVLCMDFIKNALLYGDGGVSHLYELPQDLFDCLVSRLPPVALQKLQDGLPLNDENEQDEHNTSCSNQRKRKRFEGVENLSIKCEHFQSAWRALFKSRFPGYVRIGAMYRCAQSEENYDFENDWQQMFWEMHLHSCLNEAVEKAVLPCFEGCLGEIKIPDKLLERVGFEQCQSDSEVDWSTLFYQCQQFASYVKYLGLPGVLCQEEICVSCSCLESSLLHCIIKDLLRSSKLEVLEIRWIISRDQVEALCKFLSQNGETLVSVKIIHSKLPSGYVNAICDSLRMKDLRIFSINTSSFFLANSLSIPAGLESFLSSTRSLSSVSFRDCQLHRSSAKMIFSALLNASSNITALDLSENNISGWLSDFKWRPSGHSQLSSRVVKSLKSLRVLGLSRNDLGKDDAECLRCALVCMPNLENLDLSGNPIEDDGLKSLIPYFIGISERLIPFVDLKLENCGLSCHGVSHLLQVLSNLKKPMKSLSIRDNIIGSKLGVHLGKFLCTGIYALDIEDIGLGSSGFMEAQEHIKGVLKLGSINISHNAGGVEAAKFISKLIRSAPELVEVDASFNVLPLESVSIICSSLDIAEGTLKHLSLKGNSLCCQPASVALLKKYCVNGKPIVSIPEPLSSSPYDQDP